MRDRELDVGEVALDEVHVAPRDDALGHGLAEGAREAENGALERRRQRAQDAAGADLGAEQAKLRGVGVGELEVVYADDAHAAGVDDLLVEDVARDEDLVGLQVREADLGRGDLEVDLLLVVGVDVLAPADHEGGAAGAFERKAGHAGKNLARGDAEVGNRADLLAVCCKNRVAHELGQIDHSCSLLLDAGAAWLEHAAGHRLAGRGFMRTLLFRGLMVLRRCALYNMRSWARSGQKAGLCKGCGHVWRAGKKGML